MFVDVFTKRKLTKQVIHPLGKVIDEAGSFEERLVLAELDLSAADGSTVLRTIGGLPRYQKLYGLPDGGCEHPDYAAWMKAGLKLVKTLESG